MLGKRAYQPTFTLLKDWVKEQTLEIVKLVKRTLPSV